MPVVTSKTDPTNQARLRKKAKADFEKRLKRSQNAVIRLFNLIPRKKTTQQVIVNDSEVIWQYVFDDDTLLLLADDITAIINEHLETEEDEPLAGWWFGGHDETSWRFGALSENTNIHQLLASIAGILILLTPQQVVTSQSYLTGLAQEIVASFTSLSGLSDKTSKQIFQMIVSGMQGGLTPSSIKENIVRRFDVAISSANRIVDTEINRINNTGRTNLVTTYRDDFGINAAVVHISAFIPTTRPPHGARHGSVYTPEQQNAWWNTGVNRINCHCSVRTVLLEDDGSAQETAFITKLKKQKKDFFTSG